VLLAIDGQRVERTREPTDDGHAQDRFFGEKRNAARRMAKDEDRIDQTVRMIDDEDDCALLRHAPEAGDLYAPKEDAQRQSQQADDNASDHLLGNSFMRAGVTNADQSGAQAEI